MNEDNKYIVVTHVMSRGDQKVSGPYFSVINGLIQNNNKVLTLELPLVGFNIPIYYGKSDNQKLLKLNKLFGKFTPLKYIADFIVTFVLLIKLLRSDKNKSVIIGIDPLPTVPAVLLKPFLNFKLIFYSVDFNENRFQSVIMQKMYGLFDKVASIGSDQIWAVCKSLIDYKKTHYMANAIYIPNSFTFNDSYYKNGKDNRTGGRVVWTGSILTDKQVRDIVRICDQLQQLRPELEFWFVPTNKQNLFRQEIESKHLKNTQIHNVNGQDASSRLVAQCDLGLAIYDKDFGSTKYIEPIKIWEYMLCALPFIISLEPSLNEEVLNKGIALQLEPDNQLPTKEIVAKFIAGGNLLALSEPSLEMAQKYSIKNLIAENLAKL